MRDRQGRHAGTIAVLAAIVATLVLGCGSTVPSLSATTSAAPSPTPYCFGSKSVIRWFVGLGGGTQPDEIAAEKAFVKSYDWDPCNPIYINLEIIPNDEAYDKLKQEIAAGNAPDIIGPVGARGRSGFEGEFLDLAPLIAKDKTDLSDFEPAVVDSLKDAEYGQIGLPYTIYPGYIFYRPDLFEAAGLPEPPHRVGEKYQGREWTWDALAGVAKQLTVDKNGKTGTEPGFDGNSVVQYGFAFEFADAGRIGSCFGGGSLVAADGRTAQIPGDWVHAWEWYYDAMWTSHFAFHGGNANIIPPIGSYSTLGAGGRIAMEPSWPWAIGSYGGFDMGGTSQARFDRWDIAVMPSYGGRTSSPMDADTFLISSSTIWPGDTYSVMLDIMADPTLIAAYGGVPARKSLQADYFAALDAKLAPIFPGNKVDWSVVSEMSKYPAVPSHETGMPGFEKASQVLTSFLSRLETKRGLNIDAEIANLKRQLQAAFDQDARTPAR